VRTTDAKHEAVVLQLLTALEAGHIYRAAYEALLRGCEEYKDDDLDADGKSRTVPLPLPL
jgi:hypothetical protein